MKHIKTINENADSINEGRAAAREIDQHLMGSTTLE